MNHALVAAFPDAARLERMVRFRCDVSLARITAPGPLDQMVYELIEAAEAEGWTARLVAGARESNPGNAELATAAAALDLAVKAPEGRALEPLITKEQGFLDPVGWRERLGILDGQVCKIEYVLPRASRQPEPASSSALTWY